MLGIDSSPAMLAQARRTRGRRRRRPRAAGGRHAGPRARRAGRTDLLPLPRAAPPSDVGRPAARLRAGPRLLRPGGRFAWNSFVFDPRLAVRVDGEWQEQNGVRHRIDQAKHDNRLDITLESGDAISLWWLNRSEWEGLIEVAGFEVEALYGGFERQPFDENATEFVWVVRKPVVPTTRSRGSTTRGARASPRTWTSTWRRRALRRAGRRARPAAPAGSRSRSRRPASA